MNVEIYRGRLTLMEHTYFASREIGIYYETEPVIGNYALAYALGWCAAPYNWSGTPRYKIDLAPINARGLYTTPGTFAAHELRYALTQFNAQSDSYYFRFDQNAIALQPEKKARPANFPQSGKIRMLGQGSRATFFVISTHQAALRFPSYIRLGKFHSKARVQWERLALKGDEPVEREAQLLDFLLNAADLSPTSRAHLRAFSLYNIHPAPLLRQCHLGGPFWHCIDDAGKDVYIPAGMQFGVDRITS